MHIPTVLVQLQVTTAEAPHATRGPNDALHEGAPRGMLVVVGVAIAVTPPAPTAWMVQVSPAAPTVYGPEPVQGTGPLDGVVPVQTWLHDVALMQFQVATAAPPHAGRAPNDAVHAGGPPAPRQETVAVAVPELPPAPTPLMVQRSPAGPTV